jgi:ribosomal protein S12 methylthiotransferase
MPRKPKVHVLTLGCAKNVVDSEVLLGQVRENKLEIASSAEEAEIAIINTCGFIQASKAESIDAILETAQLKATGSLKKLFVVGCLSQRYQRELMEELPEVDEFFGVNEHERILAEIAPNLKYNLLGERVLSTPSHYAYLKISEGCNHPCSFCAIPLMRGKHVSRPMEEILSEAGMLAARGVKELVLIAQDLSYYGIDISRRRELPLLLERLARVEGIRWIRLMYLYPANFPMEILDVMVDNPNVCRYIDMPIQHCSDEVLKSMWRGMTHRSTEELIERVRQKIPEVALRTTFIVGYPTETEKEFQELLDFVEETRFDRVGVFTYSQEENTTAEPLGDCVPLEEKERRKAVIMQVQREISREKNEALIGSLSQVLIDRKEGDTYVGRTERDAPEVDNEVFIDGCEAIVPGNFYTVRVVDAVEYDLFAEVVAAATNRREKP